MTGSSQIKSGHDVCLFVIIGLDPVICNRSHVQIIVIPAQAHTRHGRATDPAISSSPGYAGQARV
jgi:hypothetical protein